MQRLASPRDHMTYRSLAFYCTRFGILVPDDVTGADIGALRGGRAWSQVHDHVRADVLKTTELARRIGVLARDHSSTTTGPCDGLTVHQGTSPMRGPDRLFPSSPFRSRFHRSLSARERRACQRARECLENAKVRRAVRRATAEVGARRDAVPEGGTRGPSLAQGTRPALTARQRPGHAQGAHVCRPPSLDGPTVDRR